MKKLKIDFRLIILFLVGGVMRALTCLWGWPYRLHPDEKYIVDKTIDMVNRSSWEADVYEWPGHLPIKIDSFLFNRLSWIMYHDIPADTFEDHKIFYYIVARLVTVCFGALMIILAYLVAERLRKGTGIFAGLLVCFYSSFIRNSALATTDIPLATLFLLIIYLAILYSEKSNDNIFKAMCVVVGAAMTTKYPGTLFAMFPAFVIIREGIVKKDYLFILKKAVHAVIIVFLTVMLLAPNLIINFYAVKQHVIGEATYDIEGSVGYGILGNIFYYTENMMSYAGGLFLIFIIAGILYCVRSKNPATKVLLVAILYYVIICNLNLQLERWGTPSYALFLVFASLGVGYLFDIIKEKAADKKYLKYALSFAAFLFAINVVTGGIQRMTGSVVKDNRVRALYYCEENGITEENTRFDGYSPFNLSNPMKIKVALDDNGHLKASKGIKYILTSSGVYDRYYKDEEKYKDTLVRYKAIENEAPLIMEWKEIDNDSYSCILNTYYNITETIRFINGGGSGDTIRIYEAPAYEG